MWRHYIFVPPIHSGAADIMVRIMAIEIQNYLEIVSWRLLAGDDYLERWPARDSLYLAREYLESLNLFHII